MIPVQWIALNVFEILFLSDFQGLQDLYLGATLFRYELDQIIGRIPVSYWDFNCFTDAVIGAWAFLYCGRFPPPQFFHLPIFFPQWKEDVL